MTALAFVLFMAVFCLSQSVGMVAAPPVLAEESGITASDLLKKLKDAKKKAAARKKAILESAAPPQKQKKAEPTPQKLIPPPPEEKTVKEDPVKEAMPKEEESGKVAAEETPPKAESPGIEPETEPKAAMKAAPEKQSQPEQAKPAGSRAAELAAKLRAARGAPPKKKRPPAAKKDESTSTSSPPPKATEDKAGGKTRKKKELVKAAPDKAKSSKKGAPIPLFGTKEVRSANLKPFPKWTGVIDRYFSDANVKKGSCEKTKFNKCHLKAWKSFLKKIEGKDRKTQIKKVNDFMNRAKYIVDTKNYQQPDYWATPGQFFNKNGDCEDYAIAKYMSLRALGFGNEDMRIVVLQDLNLKIPHAVLAVYTDNGPVLLDNQIPQVIPAKSVFHYKPVYSMNENFWWLHRG